jgi:hypothetical protein
MANCQMAISKGLQYLVATNAGLNRTTASATPASALERLGSPAPGWRFHIGRDAGVDFCGIERCSGFGCRKSYGRALLVVGSSVRRKPIP